MRVNIYAEEMTERLEIISKTVEGNDFTGLRFYLHLPVTHPETGENIQGPFMHRPGDDDSAAVTFWGKKDLRLVLLKALEMLDNHYKEGDDRRLLECSWVACRGGDIHEPENRCTNKYCRIYRKCMNHYLGRFFDFSAARAFENTRTISDDMEAERVTVAVAAGEFDPAAHAADPQTIARLRQSKSDLEICPKCKLCMYSRSLGYCIGCAHGATETPAIRCPYSKALCYGDECNAAGECQSQMARTAAAQAERRLCRHCGTNNHHSATYCTHCGRSLNSD